MADAMAAGASLPQLLMQRSAEPISKAGCPSASTRTATGQVIDGWEETVLSPATPCPRAVAGSTTLTTRAPVNTSMPRARRFLGPTGVAIMGQSRWFSGKGASTSPHNLPCRVDYLLESTQPVSGRTTINANDSTNLHYSRRVLCVPHTVFAIVAPIRITFAVIRVRRKGQGDRRTPDDAVRFDRCLPSTARDDRLHPLRPQGRAVARSIT